jgi:magnesium chelatase subunit D
VRAPVDVASRTEAVRRQLAVERLSPPDLDDFAAADQQLRSVLTVAMLAHVDLGDDVVEVASRLALEVGAEGLRADLMLCRAAGAAAAIDGRAEASFDDVRAVAEMVLGHRRRRRPFDEPGITPEELDQAWDAVNSSPTSGRGESQHDEPSSPAPMTLPTGSSSTRGQQASSGKFDVDRGPRGRFVRDEPFDPHAPQAIDARSTAMALATRRATQGDSSASLAASDLRAAHRQQKVGTLVTFVVDASASMGVEHRMAATKAAVLGLLADAYRRRGRVALVTFGGRGAQVVLRPTASVEIARARLVELPTGGATPLAAGIDAATAIVDGASGDQRLDSTVVVVTDGRATVGEPDPLAAAHQSMARLARTGARVVVIDTETGHTRLGCAAQLAESAGGVCLPMATSRPEDLEQMVRAL